MLMHQMKTLFVVTGLIATFAMSYTAPLAKAAFVNGSFESPTNPPAANSYVQNLVPDNWTASQRVGGYFYRMYLINTLGGQSPPDGDQWIEFKNEWIWQNTGILLVPGTTYKLTADVRNGETASTPQPDLQLWAADDTLSSGTIFATQSWAADTDWTTHSLEAVYTGPAGKYLTVSVGVGTELDGATDGYVDADNVTLTTIVPEPVTALLLGLGGCLLAVWRRNSN